MISCIREKVRYIGLSNFNAWQIAKADGLARLMGTERFCSVQAYYSLIGRDLEREILPAALDLGIGTMIWSPLAGGFLSGKYSRANEGEGRRKSFDYPPINRERGYGIIDVLKEIADDHHASVAQIALAWLRHQNGVTTIIVGATKEHQLIENLKSLEIELSEDELKRIDNVSAIEPQYPNWFAPMERGQDYLSRWTTASPDLK